MKGVTPKLYTTSQTSLTIESSRGTVLKGITGRTVFEVTKTEWVLNQEIVSTKEAMAWGTLPYYIFSSASEQSLS